jgi:hypothetical protein
MLKIIKQQLTREMTRFASVLTIYVNYKELQKYEDEKLLSEQCSFIADVYERHGTLISHIKIIPVDGDGDPFGQGDYYIWDSPKFL